MSRRAVAVVAIVAIVAVGFVLSLVLVPGVPVAEYPPCPPPGPALSPCRAFTYHESLTFFWFRLGAIQDGHGYRLVDGRTGFCAYAPNGFSVCL